MEKVTLQERRGRGRWGSWIFERKIRKRFQSSTSCYIIRYAHDPTLNHIHYEKE